MVLMIYEISNPSDPITIEYDDEKVAIAAILYLGRGKLGLTDEEGRDVLPVFLLAGDDYIEQWMKEKGIVDDFVTENKAKIADCLDTAVVGGIMDRKGIIAAISKEEDYRGAIERWNDVQRTSLNDIAGAAFEMADAIRRGMKKEEGAEDVAT
jgi:hypothetical protein